MIENQLKSSEISPPHSKVVDCVNDLFRDIYMQIKWSQNIVSTKSRKL